MRAKDLTKDDVGKTFDVPVDGETKRGMTLVNKGNLGAVFCSNGKTFENFTLKGDKDCVFISNRDQREIAVASVGVAAARRRKSRRRRNRNMRRTRRNYRSV